MKLIDMFKTAKEEIIMTIHMEKIGDMAIIECQGKIAESDAGFKLRTAVMSQLHSRTVVIDLSEVHAIEGGGLRMLSALQRWAEEESIQLKFFNPRYSVRNELDKNELVRFHIAPFEEMMTLLARAESLIPKAA
jgi:anti-anti-sigma regulatory factor